jgi:hypothetical protein
MGNRAVLCLNDNGEQGFNKEEVGIYLHWHGDIKNIDYYLRVARKRMGNRLGDSEYAKARLIGVIHEEIEGNLSLGVGIVGYMDYKNTDNGTYIIDCETLTIKGKKFNDIEYNL